MSLSSASYLRCPMGHPNQSFRKIRWKGEESLRTRKNKIDQRTICLHMEVGDLCTLAFPLKGQDFEGWVRDPRFLGLPDFGINIEELSWVKLGRKLCEEASAVAICLHHSIICSKKDEERRPEHNDEDSEEEDHYSTKNDQDCCCWNQR